MHILVYKLRKDTSLGRLIAFLLVFALIVPLITHYYLGKHAMPSEKTPIEHFQSRSKLDRPVGKEDLLLDSIEDLKFQVEELQRIKLSLTNELRELEGRKSRLLKDISSFAKKADGSRTQAEHYHADVVRAQRELELIKLAKQRANDCPQLPHLKLPQKLIVSSASDVSPLPHKRTSSNCQLHNCFDFSRCSFSSGFPVYVYERPLGQRTFDSETIAIWQLLKGMPHYTSEADKACLFIVIVGSTEGIEQQKSNSEFESELHALPYWGGNGRNHLILHSKRGEKHLSSFSTLNINTGFALIAQSTFSEGASFRHGFDIVLPPSNGPIKGEVWKLAALQLPARRKHLLSFQAEHATRLTEKMGILRDQLNELSREASDFFIELYLSKSDSSDSKESSEWLLWGKYENRTNLLKQSTFTLILGSNSLGSSWGPSHIRLLEALQFGAVPVILSSRTVLPFNDVIDWHKAAIILSPARLPELNVLLRTITSEDILVMRRQGRFLWETYLSTTNAMLTTVLATIRTRLSIPPHHVPASPSPSVFSDSRPPLTSSPDPDAVIGLPQESPTFTRNLTSTVVDMYNLWNSPPGSFLMYPSSPFDPVLPSSAPFKNSSKGFELIGEGAGGAGAEFSKALGGNYPMEQFTIVILTYERELVLMEAIQRLVGLQYLNKVVVVWNSPEPPSLSLRWPDIGVPVHVVKVAQNSLNNRFIPYDVIDTDAVFAIDDDVEMRHDEILLAFRVWRENKDRIVGFPGRFHAWDAQNSQWLYSSEYSCELSMILTGAAFYHKYFAYLYMHWMPQVIRDKVDEYMNCEDIAMNFLVSHITRKPPLKVTSRWTFSCPNCPVSLWNDKTHFEERSKCINFFVEVYGYMPLMRTQYRADSVLFKTRLPSDKSKCFKYV